MRTAFVPISMSLGLIVVAGTGNTMPVAVEADAGEAIVSDQSHCTPRDAVRTDPPLHVRLECVAIYRNTSDQPVFDIAVQALLGGRSAQPPRGWTPPCCPNGSRRALASGEQAIWRATLLRPEGVEPVPLTLRFTAAWTGALDPLDVPAPELQYLDGEQRGARTGWVGEVRNVDARMWNGAGGEAGTDWAPVLALFHEGELVGATQAPRVPSRRVPTNGRYVFAAYAPDTAPAIDSVQAFFLDTFGVPYPPGYAAGHWQLTGLDHHVETDGTGHQRMRFRIAVRNESDLASEGSLVAIARRADFHAIGAGRCETPTDVEPGAEASCSGDIALFGQRFDATFDDVEFVTAEVGVAIARVRTPTPTATATPCPPLATPAPAATLPSVAGVLFFPWSTRMLAERCP